VARRQQLIEMRTMELNRLEHAQKDLKKSIEDHLRYLNKQIKPKTSVRVDTNVCGGTTQNRIHDEGAGRAIG